MTESAWQLRQKARKEAEAALIVNLRANKDKLVSLLARNSGEWGLEDPIYRFYHQSFKVYRLQDDTKTITAALADLNPAGSDVSMLCARYLEIYRDGTTQTFDMLRSNANWGKETRPIVEAFLHARFLLEMAVKFTEETTEGLIPSGWGAFLYLYGLR